MDFSKTVYYVAVVGIFFPLWMSKTLSMSDAIIGNTIALSMTVTFICSPLIGSISDQTGKRVPYLFVGILACVISTLSIGFTENVFISITAFAIGLISINLSDVIYNAMLFDVSEEFNRSKISGFGAATGYAGAILAIILAITFSGDGNYIVGFRVVALTLLVLSIPAMIFIKEKKLPSRKFVSLYESFFYAYSNFRKTFIEIIRSRKDINTFLIAKFWYTCSVYTAQTFAVLYGVQTAGYSERQVQLLVFFGTLIAIPSAYFLGVLVGKFGSKIVLINMLSIWILVLLTAAFLPNMNFDTQIFWIILTILCGISISGIWVSDRPYMLDILPKSIIGQGFSVHSMSARLSSIIGPFTWGIISTTINLRQQAALMSLVVFALIGLFFVFTLEKNKKNHII